MAKKKRSLGEHADQLRDLALRYPDTYEEHPWGERVIKVRKKVFVFFGSDEARFSCGFKLPHSSFVALELPFTEPTHYGMGKHGWVTARFGPKDAVPFELLGTWMDESYRAIAPKRVVAALPEAGPPLVQEAPKPRRKRRRGVGPVVLAVDDAGRSQRAVQALEAEGLVAIEVEPDPEAVVAAVKRKRPSAIVIDLGRRTANGLALASSLRSTDLAAVPLILAGIRDARSERKVAATLEDVDLTSRKPPGDEALVSGIVEIATKR